MINYVERYGTSHEVTFLLTQDYIGLILVYTVIAVSLGTALVLKRRGSGIDVRKVTHIGVGNFVFIWWMFSEGWVMLAFFTVPFALLLFITMFKGNRLSDSELGEISNDMGHRTGLFFYAVSVSVMILLFFDHWLAATIGMIAMTYGDGFGSVFGKRFGKHKTVNGKSLEGSLGVVFVTALVSGIVVSIYTFLSNDVSWAHTGPVTAIIPIWAVCIVAGVVASVVETFSPGQADNITIPLSVAIVCVLLGL